MKNIIFVIAALVLLAPATTGQILSGVTDKVVKGVTILLPEVISGNNIEYWTPPGRTTPVLPDFEPGPVCTGNTAPGGRFTTNPCAAKADGQVPNFPPAYNCETVFGAGKCTKTDFYAGAPGRYIPTCPTGFQYVGGYTVTPNGSGGWSESVSKFKEGDQYYYVTRGQILCARLTPKRPVVTSFDGPYTVMFAEESKNALTGDWVPTGFDIKIVGDKLSGTVVSKAGRQPIEDGKISEEISSLDGRTVFKLAEFTITVGDIDYKYVSEAPITSNLILDFKVEWLDAEGDPHRASIRFVRPDEWLMKNRPNIPR